MEVSGQLHLERESPWYPLDRRLGGPQSSSRRGGEEKNSQPLPIIEPPIIQPVAQGSITELSRLLRKQMGKWKRTVDDRKELTEVLEMTLIHPSSRTALGPTQPPIQWVPGALSLCVKRTGREVDHSPPSSAEVEECVELYLHSPNMSSWRGA
jgi:hypothetical protein